MKKLVSNRYDIVCLFDVKLGNPNGDPDADNMPRVDPETGRGIVTDVCIKRKNRNYVAIKHGYNPPYDIYIREKGVLETIRENVMAEHDRSDARRDIKDRSELMTTLVKERFFDVRAFGAVLSLNKSSGRNVRGAIQFTAAMSIDPVCVINAPTTRVAVETEAESKRMNGFNQTIGRKHIIPYALYRMDGYINANDARKNGLTEDDLKLFWESLESMFIHDRSAARGSMAVRKIFVFRHEAVNGDEQSAMLGSRKWPPHVLQDAIDVRRKGEEPARSFKDYTIDIDNNVIGNLNGEVSFFDGVDDLIK